MSRQRWSPSTGALVDMFEYDPNPWALKTEHDLIVWDLELKNDDLEDSLKTAQEDLERNASSVEDLRTALVNLMEDVSTVLVEHENNAESGSILPAWWLALEDSVRSAHEIAKDEL